MVSDVLYGRVVSAVIVHDDGDQLLSVGVAE